FLLCTRCLIQAKVIPEQYSNNEIADQNDSVPDHASDVLSDASIARSAAKPAFATAFSHGDYFSLKVDYEDSILKVHFRIGRFESSVSLNGIVDFFKSLFPERISSSPSISSSPLSTKSPEYLGELIDIKMTMISSEYLADFIHVGAALGGTENEAAIIDNVSNVTAL
ncbi:hypothetical protein PRIPAC_83806, partial [Pristionchus pacificus]|uniref:Uncharacterized protein n=1 Tax=Pristionchus pacificus TaxID=54126 RepID=A0A2A6BSM6_PRIPA